MLRNSHVEIDTVVQVLRAATCDDENADFLPSAYDLPGMIQNREFPGEFKGWTLAMVEAFCSG